MKDFTKKYKSIQDLLIQDKILIISNKKLKKDVNSYKTDNKLNEFFKIYFLNEKIEFLEKIKNEKFNEFENKIIFNMKIKIQNDIKNEIKRRNYEFQKNIILQHFNSLVYEFFKSCKNKNFDNLFSLKEILYLFLESYNQDYI